MAKKGNATRPETGTQKHGRVGFSTPITAESARLSWGAFASYGRKLFSTGGPFQKIEQNLSQPDEAGAADGNKALLQLIVARVGGHNPKRRNGNHSHGQHKAEKFPWNGCGFHRPIEPGSFLEGFRNGNSRNADWLLDAIRVSRVFDNPHLLQ